MPTLTLYDSTLRDGSQAEGITFSVDDKILIAKRLDELGVHYIEGGWPNPTNPKDLEFFQRAKSSPFKKAKITAFGSTRRASNKPEEDPILNTLLKADTATIALFGKSWDLHVTDVLRTDLETNLQMIKSSVAYLKARGKEVIYDAEHFFDGYEANSNYAIQTLLAAQEGGADILVLCDTNGGCLPLALMEIIKATRQAIAIPFGIHTHNDAGMVVANTMIAVQLGASQVQGTCNGYGERCGNADLCPVIANLKLKLGIDCVTDDQLQGLMALSRFVSEIANISHDRRQPYVGESAFSHKGGAHADGVLKNERSFEHVQPELVGNQRHFPASDQAGGGLIVERLKQLGYKDIAKQDSRVQTILNEVKQRENRGYAFEAASASFEILVRKVMGDYTELFKAGPFRTEVWRGEAGQLFSEAIVEVSVAGTVEQTVARGDGPVDALNKALRQALEKFYPQLKPVHLEDYKVRVLSSAAGTASSVRVLIESSDGRNGDVWTTVAVSENIIEASWEALVDSLRYKLLKDGCAASPEEP